MAAIKRADVLKGVNPAAEKLKAKVTAVKDMTVRTLIQDYKQKKFVTFAKSAQVCYTWHLKRVEHRLPVVREMLMSSSAITRADLHVCV